MALSFPYRFDASGRTAEPTGDAVRELLEQVLFTAPGERLHRPDFGSGLMRLLFAGASPEAASAAHALVQGALQQWLGHVLLVDAVEVDVEDAKLVVRVAYRLRRTGEPGRVELERSMSRA